MYSLYVNGQLVGITNNYCTIIEDVKRFLRSGVSNKEIRIVADSTK